MTQNDAPASSKILKALDLSCDYKGEPVLEHVSLTIERSSPIKTCVPRLDWAKRRRGLKVGSSNLSDDERLVVCSNNGRGLNRTGYRPGCGTTYDRGGRYPHLN